MQTEGVSPTRIQPLYKFGDKVRVKYNEEPFIVGRIEAHQHGNYAYSDTGKNFVMWENEIELDTGPEIKRLYAFGDSMDKSDQILFFKSKDTGFIKGLKRNSEYDLKYPIK